MGEELSTAAVIEKLLCEDPSAECHLGFCSSCPKLNVMDDLVGAWNEDQIEFYQRKSTDRTTVNKLTEGLQDFRARVKQFVPKIITNDLIARKQAEFIARLKEDVLEDDTTAIIHVDFAMNYSYVYQDEEFSSVEAAAAERHKKLKGALNWEKHSGRFKTPQDMPSLPLLEVHGDSFRINTRNFNYVLDKVLDLPIVILSMNGKLREGKSYVLNYFIRYLKNGTKEDWFEVELPDDEMFPWRSGSHRVTAGINIWSEPFIHDLNGEQVAVLLLDCQGLYDERTTQQQNATVFSLSCLLSSVMIYNAKNKIEDELLEKLRFFSNYTKAVSTITPGHEDTRPYLMFLLRDFEFISEFDFGFHNKDSQPQPIRGERGNYFYRIFTTTDDMTEENQSNREALRECYKDIGMFLMPYPGTNFIEDSVKNQPEDRFQKVLKELVIHTVDNLVTKRLGEEEVTGRSFQPYVNMWAELCENGEFPESLTIEEMSSKLQSTVAVTQALETFKEKFRVILSSKDSGCDDEELNNRFTMTVEESVAFFNSKRSLRYTDSGRVFVDILRLRNDCLRYFREHCVPINQSVRQEKNFSAITKAKHHFNAKLDEYLSSGQAGIDDNGFEKLFDSFFLGAKQIFNAHRASGSEDTVLEHLNTLIIDCLTHFESCGKPLNRKLRHGRNTDSVALALENFKQDFNDFLNSDKAGVKDAELSKMKPRVLHSAIQVFHSNRSSGSDDTVKSYLDELKTACEIHFRDYCVPKNQRRRSEWRSDMTVLGVVGVGTAVLGGLIGALVNDDEEPSGSTSKATSTSTSKKESSHSRKETNPP
ncbi:unnamed protein product [Allacma fusca]|uniref:GB1/RHD3-type G domain-containing protein n=1 Tax=Allacma fusca TaxID=39272 RepID=A0A8J2KBX2_9HEXA|nr:unnamed protein product [Allacma fusca]